MSARPRSDWGILATFNLEVPNGARRFLNGLKTMDGKLLSGFSTNGDEFTEFTILSDEQAMAIAAELHDGLYLLGALYWEERASQ